MPGPRANEATILCPHCSDAHPRDAKACPMTGRPMPGAFVSGQVLEGKYRIVKHIADGGMGAVYEAEHLVLGKHVAIKTLHPDLSKSEDLVHRLQTEARAASAIGHEHIVDVLDLGRTLDGSLFIVMELLKGQNLGERLKAEGGLLEVGRAGHVLKQVLAALSAAHRVNIIHRDLKPENIYLIQRRGDPDFVKVLDFGTAKLMADAPDAKLESTGFVLGTPYYMAPEQARGGAVDHRVDIYACGALLYHMVTGRVPFSAPNFNALMFEIASGRYAPPRAIVPDIPPAFEQIINWAMALDMAQRFQSADQFMQAIVPYAQAPGGLPTSGSSKATIPHSSVPTLVLDAMKEQDLREAARPTGAVEVRQLVGAVPEDIDEDIETTVLPENPYANLPPPPTPNQPSVLPAINEIAGAPPGHQTLATVPGKQRVGDPTAGVKTIPAGKPVAAPQQQRTVPMMEAPHPVQIIGQPVQVAAVPLQPIAHQPGPMPAMQPMPPGVVPPVMSHPPLQPGMTPGHQYGRAATPVAPGPPPGAQMIGQPMRPYAMNLPAQAAPLTRSGARTGSRGRYTETSSRSVVITVVVGVIVGLGLGAGIIWFVRYQRARNAPRPAPAVTVKNQQGSLPLPPGPGETPTPPQPGTPATPPSGPGGTPPVIHPPSRIEATLSFEVSPPEAASVAEIHVDDAPVRGTTARVTVKPGQKVRVIVKASGFNSYDHRIAIEGDITIDVRLKKRSGGGSPRSGGGGSSGRDKPSGPGGSLGDL